MIIKLCPFCGSIPFEYYDQEDKVYYIHCTKGDKLTHGNCCIGPSGDTKEKAVELWNIRNEKMSVESFEECVK
jgi:hypothetical protein